MSGDPFGTAAIRERVLAGWSAGAVRLREDANAEEDLVLGGYRDRVLVELAQNAADAAARAGVPGRLLLHLIESADSPSGLVLLAANTGAPLDADGVQALATLRASAKRDVPTAGPPTTAVGRFGVGFAAVLGVSDDPAIVSADGGVRFSRLRTLAAVSDAAEHAPGLAEELARRDGHVPVLRLPFPDPGESPPGFATAVLLPLRDDAAVRLVERLLAELDDALLLALPGLAQVQVEGPASVRPRVIEGVADRWQVLRRTGGFDPALLADRPTEERRRTSWSVTWALPDDARSLPGTLYAPTPTDEPLPWSALLIASFPLDPSRRHVAPGPATDELVRQAALAYADLVVETAHVGESARVGEPARDADRYWSLVPTGLAAGTLDGALRAGVVQALRTTRFLRPAEPPPAGDQEQLLRPRDAVVLDPPAGADPAVVAALAPVLAGLVAAPRSARPALDVLDVPRIALAEVVEQLPTAGRDAAAWRELYDAFEPLAADPLVREALAALPVPLADGRVVRGARGLVLPGGSAAVAEALGVLGVRAVAADAVHGLLERLGARRLTAREALELPEVRAVVGSSLDRREDGDHEHVDAVLTLVAQAVAESGAGEADPVWEASGAAEPTPDAWLGELALLDQDGEITPAAELVLPGSMAEQVLDPDAVGVVAPELAERWTGPVLRAVGVLDSLVTLRLADVPLGELGGLDVADIDGGAPPLPDWPDWVDASLAGAGVPPGADATCPELVAIRDLDAVRDDAWPQVLAAIAADRVLRAAVVDRTRIVVANLAGARDGTRHGIDVPSFTAWWLRRELFDARPWTDPDADLAVLALLGPAPALGRDLDPGLRAALGAVRSIGDLDAGAVQSVLDGLADPGLELGVADLLAVWAGLARLALAGAAELDDVAAPESIRALAGGRPVVVDAATALVVDDPAWLQRPDLAAAVVVRGDPEAAALADLLDLPLASQSPVVLDGPGEPVPVPAQVHMLLPQAPAQWREHDALTVDGVEVSWWVQGRGPGALVHASTVDGLARGLAWAAGRWDHRAAVERVIEDPDALDDVLVDDAFGG